MGNLGKKYGKLIFPSAIIASSALLFLSSFHSFLLFHTLVELFTVVIAFGIFTIAWSSRWHINNAFLFIIGVSYLFIGGLDLVHMLTYKGLGIIKSYDADLPTQLWIAARYLESLSFIVGFLAVREKGNGDLFQPRRIAHWLFLIYTAIFLAVLNSILYRDVFPAVYRDGYGLTSFKIYSEYAISVFFLLSIILIFQKRKMFDVEMVNLLSLSLIVKIFSELAFTEYVGVYDFSNIIGHIFRFISYMLFYKAVLESGLMKPYRFLFRDLKKSEERYRSLVEFSPDPIVVHSAGRISYANGPAKKIFGLPKGNRIIGAEIASFFLPEYRDQIRLRIENISKGWWRQAPTVEMEILRPDGQTVPAEVKSIRINYMGKVAVESIIRDVSERKAAEEKIRSLAKFPEENPNPVIRVLKDGQVQYANQPAHEMLSSFGWMEGAPLPNDLFPSVGEILEKPGRYETELVCPSGRIFSIVLAPNADEGWVNLYGRDITQGRLAEKELARTQKELRKRIEEQLEESYRHLGTVNRKISILLELESQSQRRKNKQEFADYILGSALGLSRAESGSLHITMKKENRFGLVSNVGLKKDGLDHVRSVSGSSADFIDRLVKKKCRVNGSCELIDAGCFKKAFDPSYFVALPILHQDACRGFLFLGFTDRKSMEVQELEFLDIFAKHASAALAGIGVLG